ncbi:MAG: hypothetical protein JXN59_09190, partial [Anaerolineae bacterium]|nr:hypothetical protein [Anaerolineae bacterium]
MRAVRMISLLTLLLAIGTACAPAPATPTIPPEIRITRPATGTAFAEGANILILVEAADSGPGITRILLALDGQAVNERQFSAAADISTSFDWLALGTGSHSLSVTAYRADGTSSPAAQVQITVAAPTATPTVTPTQTP